MRDDRLGGAPDLGQRTPPGLGPPRRRRRRRRRPGPLLRFALVLYLASMPGAAWAEATAGSGPGWEFRASHHAGPIPDGLATGPRGHGPDTEARSTLLAQGPLKLAVLRSNQLLTPDFSPRVLGLDHGHPFRLTLAQQTWALAPPGRGSSRPHWPQPSPRANALRPPRPVLVHPDRPDQSWGLGRRRAIAGGGAQRQGHVVAPQCQGICLNLMSCVLSGLKVDVQSTREGSCRSSSALNVCCVQPPSRSTGSWLRETLLGLGPRGGGRQRGRLHPPGGGPGSGVGTAGGARPLQQPSSFKTGRTLFNPSGSGGSGGSGGTSGGIVQYFTSPDEVRDAGGGVEVPFLLLQHHHHQAFLNSIDEDGSTNQWHLYHDPDLREVTASASGGLGGGAGAPAWCGVSKNAQRKIMGGLDAGYGQFPWTAHIKIRGPNIDKVCGGTLINDRWVVTAGHCTQYCQDPVPSCAREVSQYDIQYKVVLGEYDQLSQLEEYPTESYLAVDVVRHPLYRNVMRYHQNGFLESEPRFDLALLQLDRPVRTAPNVAPICLPKGAQGAPGSGGGAPGGPPLPAPQGRGRLPGGGAGRSSGPNPLPTVASALTRPGTLATVVGWGRLGQDEDAPHSNILQAVTVPVLDEDDCALQTGLSVYPDQLCAGASDTDKSACPGDSGGGLQVRDASGRWNLVGVVSNGPSACGLQPVIFHKLETTMQWILETMEAKKSSAGAAASGLVVP